MPRRLLAIALLGLLSVSGVLATTAMARTSTPVPTLAQAARTVTASTLPSVPGSIPQASPLRPDEHHPAARSTGSVPCVQQVSCAGGALLTGAMLLLVLPAAGLALPAPAPLAPVAAAPTRLWSALLASKLFRPPRAS